MRQLLGRIIRINVNIVSCQIAGEKIQPSLAQAKSYANVIVRFGHVTVGLVTIERRCCSLAADKLLTKVDTDSLGIDSYSGAANGG